jgi:hypothetical protein
MDTLHFGGQLNLFGEAGKLDIASVVILLARLYLLGFGVACVLVPTRAISFFGKFASSARAHYFELAIRGQSEYL